MKKLIIITMLLISSVVYAETKLTVSGKAEIGSDIESYNMFTNMQLGLNLYIGNFKWSVYGGYRTWYIPNWQDIEFYPYRDIYSVGTEISFYGFFVNAGHFCNHAVKSNKLHGATKNIKNNRWWSNTWGETMTTISAGYKFEVPVWQK